MDFLKTFFFKSLRPISPLSCVSSGLPSPHPYPSLEFFLDSLLVQLPFISDLRGFAPPDSEACRGADKVDAMELMFAEWEDGERFSFEDSDRFEEDSLCSFISEAESLCQNWRGWRKQSAGPNSPTVKIKGGERPAAQTHFLLLCLLNNTGFVYGYDQGCL